MDVGDIPLLNPTGDFNPGLGLIVERSHVEETAKWRNTHTYFGAAYLLGNRINGFQQQTDSVLNRTAVMVCAIVDRWVDELFEQIPVSAMNFDAIETGFHRFASSLDKVIRDARDFLCRKRSRSTGLDLTWLVFLVVGIGQGVGREFMAR